MVVRYEVSDLSSKISGPSSPSLTRRVFNAALALADTKGKVHPYLAESLPKLNTDSWRVFPDGRMETTYKLRPNLTWHDGAPLTADDFAFAYRAYSAKDLALFLPTPQDKIREIVAVDAVTVLIRWDSLYPDAGALLDQDLDPLPRHILEGPLETFERDYATREAFVSHRYWTTEYVAAGPYRLVHWEPGAYLEGQAFDRHALGRPKIDRVQVMVFGDENTVLSNLLADNVHYAARLSLRFEHGLVLRQNWGTTKGGIFLESSPIVQAAIQFRPEYLKTLALMDVRVRRALASTIDKDDLNNGLFQGEATTGHTFISPEFGHYSTVDQAITKYPFDARRAEQLMNEAGFSKDRGGLFADTAGQRFQPDLWVTAGPLFEKQLAIMIDTWQKSGVDAQGWVIPVAQTRDNATRMQFPGLLSHGVNTAERDAIVNITTAEVGTAANRWSGTNRGGYANPDYDRMVDIYSTTLDRPQQIQRVTEIMKFRSDELPTIMLFFNYSVIAHTAALKGPTTHAPNTTPYWNLQDWELI